MLTYFFLHVFILLTLFVYVEEKYIILYIYISALKFQLQIDRPWGHNLSHFISKTGFQKYTQGYNSVAK